ncbi:MAG: tetratricopeptide repeat protein, partial [Candidatus Omnitrophica bacterium]|nr:tetratricopeptide repeat protein [Candidatus Omnitrophota bacterium]
GFFFFGPLFVLIGVVSEWIRRRVPLPFEWNQSGNLTEDEFKRLKLIFIFVAGACFISPYFIDGAIYPLRVLFSFSGENNIFFKYIQELQRPVNWENIFDFNSYFYYKLLIILSLISFIFNRHRIDVSALIFWMVFLAFSLGAIRNIPFFAFAAYLIFITNIAHLSFEDIFPLKFNEEKFLHLTSFFVKLVFLVWLFNYAQNLAQRVYYNLDKYELKSEFGGISGKNYPVGAVDFLVKNEIKANIFNDFNSGAYLIGKAFPNIRVFIDGRTEVYGGAFFREYQELWEKGDTKIFDKIVEKYGITIALLNSSLVTIPKDIFNHLYSSREWKIVYLDHDGVIFAKDIPVNKEIIDKFAIDMDKWQVKKVDLYKLGPTRVKPYQYYKRAYSLYTIGLYDAALGECEEALKISPGYSAPLELMGEIYNKKKDYTKAFEAFRLAALGEQSNKDIRMNLVKAYLDNGKYEFSIEQAKILIGLWPKDAKGYYYLAHAYAKTGKYKFAFDTATDAFRLNPNNEINPLKIADILSDEKQFSLAEELCALVAEKSKDLKTVAEKLGDVYAKIGKKDKAREFYAMAIKDSKDKNSLQDKIKSLDKQ